MSLSLILILLLCGILANIMSAVFGIGGGVLMVPILYTLFPDFPMQIIAATSLTIVMGSALINLIYFYQQKVPLNLKSILFWSVGMIIGVQLGFQLSFYFSDKIIIVIFVSILSLLAIRTLCYKPLNEHQVQNNNRDLLKGALLCLFGGGVAGITGIGGGSIMAPLIGQLKSVKTQQIAPYTNYMMVIGGMGSLYSYLAAPLPYQINYHWQIGYVNFSIVTIVLCSSLTMSFFSMKIRGILKPEIARKLLGIILLAIAGYMLMAYWLK